MALHAFQWRHFFLQNWIFQHEISVEQEMSLVVSTLIPKLEKQGNAQES